METPYSATIQTVGSAGPGQEGLEIILRPVQPVKPEIGSDPKSTGWVLVDGAYGIVTDGRGNISIMKVVNKTVSAIIPEI